MKQSRKLEGSFTNYLMGNNDSTPVVGQGATELMYSDRTPYEVLEVSKDGKRCVIREMSAKAKANAGGMGHQDWDILPDPTQPIERLVYKYGAWRKEFIGWDGKKATSKINILFGRAEKYYDWEF